MEFEHSPVLLNEVIEGLDIKKEGTYVDFTLGGGGHAVEVARRLSSKGILVGVDHDPEAIKASEKRLAGFKDIIGIKLVKGNFRYFRSILSEVGISYIDGALLDLGVSSYQLDNIERGFTYQENAFLDMRMDPELKITAADIINDYSKEELEKILLELGEERWAKRIVSFIISKRRRKSIKTTGELVEIIKQAIPAQARRKGPHPAKRTFQALRIAVNDELGVLEEFLTGISGFCASGGRICVISFHSLEDRIVKNIFRDLAQGCKCPKDFPLCICDNKPDLKLITKKPIEASEHEKEINPRSRSAKLRIAEKL